MSPVVVYEIEEHIIPPIENTFSYKHSARLSGMILCRMKIAKRKYEKMRQELRDNL